MEWSAVWSGSIRTPKLIAGLDGWIALQSCGGLECGLHSKKSGVPKALPSRAKNATPPEDWGDIVFVFGSEAEESIKMSEIQPSVAPCSRAAPMLCTGVKLLIRSKVPCVLFWNLHSWGERGRKGRRCKFQNKAHITFDPRINSTPVY